MQLLHIAEMPFQDSVYRRGKMELTTMLKSIKCETAVSKKIAELT